MNRITAQPKNLRDAWLLYSAYLEAENKLQDRSLVKSALLRYTLPGYGLPVESDIDAKLEFMAQIPLTAFVDALNIQQKYFDQIDLKKTNQWANRHRLNQMLTWCSHQAWWQAATNAELGTYSPRRRQFLGNAHHIKSSKRRNVTRYSLKNLDPAKLKSATPDDIQQVQDELHRIYKELEELRQFLTAAHYYRRQDKAVRMPTAAKVINILLLIYGWLYYVNRTPINSIGLAYLDQPRLAYTYVQWLKTERKVSPKTEVQAAVAFLNVAKFNHYLDSDSIRCQELSKPYCDVAIISELRSLIRDINERVKTAPISTVDESKKWLTWPEYLACVEFLKDDCGKLTSEGLPRKEWTIARSYERYLIAALLAYMPPDRQRTLRELQLGKSLIKGVIKQGIVHPTDNGLWFIVLEPEDYKTGAAYGRQVQKVPERLYPYLEEWLDQWRAVLNPIHDFVFTQMNGKPLTSE